MYFIAFNVLFYTSNCCVIMVSVHVYDGLSSDRNKSICFAVSCLHLHLNKTKKMIYMYNLHSDFCIKNTIIL